MAFDRYMVQVGAGRHPKLAGMTAAERYVFFLGVLSLAARADPRGSLKVGERPACWQDVARECSERGQTVVRSLAKLREIGLLERSDDGIEYVHDWDQWNAKPRSDATNADRQRRFRQRSRDSRNALPVTLRNAGEVKKLEVEEPPLTPPSRNGVAEAFAAELDEPAWVVRRAIRELGIRGQTATLDAVRSYLTEPL